MALNTATTDLSSLSHRSTLLPEEFRLYIGLEGADGAGGDLAYGRECVATHAAKIREHVAAHAVNADIVLLTAGLGGGTGSALSELIRVLADLELPLVALGALPSEHESGIAKVNALRAINDVVAESVQGLIFMDNGRLARDHGKISVDRYYPEINKLIMEPLDALNRLNTRRELTPIRSLDGEDIRTLMLSSGIMSFMTTTLRGLTRDGVVQAVHDGLLHNSMQPEGVQLKSISYLGLVIEAPEGMLADTPFSHFEQINQQLKDSTEGAVIHMGVYRYNTPQPTATLRVFASAQALPDGVLAMVGQAKHEGGRLRAKLQSNLTGLDLGGLEDYQRLRTHHVRRRRVPEGAPASDVGVPTRPSAQNGSSLPPVRASSDPSMSERGLSHATRYRDAYVQLITEFREADSSEAKQRASERLEQARKSDNSLVRYYAVRAMSRLDSERFAAQLEAAAQDKDLTVRAVALRALNRHSGRPEQPESPVIPNPDLR
jgi:cell division GTPase FtsZ